MPDWGGGPEFPVWGTMACRLPDADALGECEAPGRPLTDGDADVPGEAWGPPEADADGELLGPGVLPGLALGGG